MLVWNIRGLNGRSRRDALRAVVVDSKPAIVCIQETKLVVISPVLINEMLGSDFASFDYLPATNTRGGILIACRFPMGTMESLHTGEHSITVKVMLDGSAWNLTSVYGP